MKLQNSEPASVDEFSAFEERVGQAMPDGYRRFLTENNGGAPAEDDAIWTSPSGSMSLYLQYFYPLSQKEPNIISALDSFPVTLPGGLVPICLLGGGSSLLLEVSSGAIYLWDCDSEETTQVAGDISEFCSLSGDPAR